MPEYQPQTKFNSSMPTLDRIGWVFQSLNQAKESHQILTWLEMLDILRCEVCCYLNEEDEEMFDTKFEEMESFIRNYYLNHESRGFSHEIPNKEDFQYLVPLQIKKIMREYEKNLRRAAVKRGLLITDAEEESVGL